MLEFVDNSKNAMKQTKVFCSVILPTYNRLSTLRIALLPSLNKQTSSNWELIIIDDCSMDNTNEYFTSIEYSKEFPKVSKLTKYYRNDKNLGSPATRNVGFKKAQGEWCFMTEDDLEFDKPTFFQDAESIIKALVTKDGGIAVVSPQRLEYDTKGYYKNYNGKYVNYGKISKEIYLDPNQTKEGYTINTHACSFIRTSIAQNYPYDSINFKYFREESDFYETIRKNSYTLYYLGNRLVTKHRMDLGKSGGNRKNSVNIRNELKYIRGHYAFLSKHANMPEVRLVAFILVRYLKILSNLIGFPYLKNAISFFKI